jgi:hypothetical protein
LNNCFPFFSYTLSFESRQKFIENGFENIYRPAL